MSELAELQKLIREFAIERNWEKFHTPKNLALALGSEIGELLAEFRWKTDNELINLDKKALKNIELELADAAIFLLRLSEILNIDLSNAIKEKLHLNKNRELDGPDFKKDSLI